MSEATPTNATPREWNASTLGEICGHGGGSIQTGPFGSQLHSSDYKQEGIPIITVEHLRDGRISHANLPLVGPSDYKRLSRYTLRAGDLVFSRVGAIDRCAYVTDSEDGWLFSGRCLRVRAGRSKIDSKFLAYSLNSWGRRQWILNHSVGSTMACLNTAILAGLPISYPDLGQQRRIAEILSTVDEAIEQTEALIAKTQQIKTGLMHDLFTRGVTPDGRLRPPRDQAPELYKQSPLGWIPLGWDVVTLASIAVSLVDGPFGSNLKTEHYVDAEGVRVVRLQNILEGEYNDHDCVFVSEGHAAHLIRHQVTAGDVLIAALGEDNNPVGRSCCYPDGLPPAINKADCFRLRCDPSTAVSQFVMDFLNTSAARNQICRFEQGVTRRRINIGNLKRVRVVLPQLHEQGLILATLDAVTAHEQSLRIDRNKKRMTMAGILHNLLTGREHVACSRSEGAFYHGR